MLRTRSPAGSIAAIRPPISPRYGTDIEPLKRPPARLRVFLVLAKPLRRKSAGLPLLLVTPPTQERTSGQPSVNDRLGPCVSTWMGLGDPSYMMPHGAGQVVLREDPPHPLRVRPMAARKRTQ